MEANYVHKDSTTLIQDKLVKNELNQIELQYNALKQQKFNELLKENKKLKEKVKKLSQWDINKDTRNSRQRVANAKLLKENQELKLELSGYRQAILNNKEMLGLKEQNEKLKQKYLNAVSDYETTMAEKNELKKQLEEKENIACNWKDSCLENAGKIEKLENQQKEFIDYLENMLDNENDIFSVVRVKDVLSKYKEIIGDKDE